MGIISPKKVKQIYPPLSNDKTNNKLYIKKIKSFVLQELTTFRQHALLRLFQLLWAPHRI